MMPRLQLQLWWQDQTVPDHARSAVSLHSHTSHSEEALDLILDHTTCWAVRQLARFVEARYAAAYPGSAMDWRRAYWTPPLAPMEAVAVERRQIEAMNLQPIVSLTDHDNCDAGLRLQGQRGFSDVPISTEWTVPFGRTLFHLGVHNLPRTSARSLMAEMAHYSAKPTPDGLAALLGHLDGLPETLVVVNHPLYDEAGIGPVHHAALLGEFLARHRGQVHALELNGMRTWEENLVVMRLAEDAGLPYVSGGDRHGAEANANLNLTRARTFPEFVQELRFRRRSHVVFLPQYQRPLLQRRVRTGLEVAAKWSERLFYRPEGGTALPLAALLQGTPRLRGAASAAL
jgi:hypothetical protein